MAVGASPLFMYARFEKCAESGSQGGRPPQVPPHRAGGSARGGADRRGKRNSSPTAGSPAVSGLVDASAAGCCGDQGAARLERTSEKAKNGHKKKSAPGRSPERE